MTDEELGEIVDSLEGFFEETGVHIALLEGVQTVTIARRGEEAEDLNEWGEGDYAQD